VELICFADRNLNEYGFRVLESSPKNRNDPNVSLSPKQTIYLVGRDLDAVGEACDLVTDLLYWYVDVEDKLKLKRSFHYDGWRKSLIGNDETGNTKHSSSNKKAKVTPKAESETISGTAVWSIPHMLQQDSTSDISAESRVRNETHPSPPTGSSQLPTSQEEVLFEYSHEKSETWRFDLDNTITIFIPRFADSVAVQGTLYLGSCHCLWCDTQTLSPFSLLDTLIGEKGRNHKSLERDTRCKIRVSSLDAEKRGRTRRMIEVDVTGHDLRRAREIVEDEILSAVRRKDKGKMLYFLAKNNDYGGSSDGIARFQRSPKDLKRRVWMAVVHMPCDFHKYSGLFVSKNGSGLTQIEEDTKCSIIQVVNSLPAYIFLSDSKVEAVNEAADAVKKRLDHVVSLYKALPRC
jgi:hypothetical protein